MESGWAHRNLWATSFGVPESLVSNLVKGCSSQSQTEERTIKSRGSLESWEVGFVWNLEPEDNNNEQDFGTVLQDYRRVPEGLQ